MPDGTVVVTDRWGTEQKAFSKEEFRQKLIDDAKAAAKAAAQPGALTKALGSAAPWGLGELIKAAGTDDPEKLYQAAMDKAGGDPALAARILRGEDVSQPPTTGATPQNAPSSTPPTSPSSDKEPEKRGPEARGDKATPQEGQVAQTAAAAPPSAGVGKFAAAPAAPTAQQASDAAERARFEALVRSYNPQANMSQFTPASVSAAENPLIADAIRQANTLQASQAQSQAFADQERARLAGLTKYTPESRDVWKQYFNPADYKAQAAQAQAAQAGMTTVAPAVTATGSYQANLAQMQGYDPTIQRSDQRAQAVELQQMAMDRAKGLKPSVAEESYLGNLDRLMTSQAAAAGSVRGQDRALAMRNLAGTAVQQGQQAVRETAILRMQEQQAAEQAAAAQSNAIMIEDQKLASQEKVNELNRNIQILQADLENQKSLLTRDTFNAEAMNKANQLQAQLDSQTRQLNAQLQNQANLQNASMQTNVSLQNALQALEASKYAGTMAQTSLANQMEQERKDWQLGYSAGRQPIEDTQKISGSLMEGLASIGGGQANRGLQQKQIDDAMARFNQELELRKDLSEEQKDQARTNMYMQLAKAGLGAIGSFASSISKDEEKEDKPWWEFWS
jgi:hypothetical protein